MSKKIFTPSPEQQEFLDWIVHGHGSAVLEAVAGAGKTTTLVEGVKLMRGSVFLGAYNKKMGAELAERIAGMPDKKAGTFHSAGFNALRRAAGNGRKLEIDDRKVRDIVDRIVDYRAEVNPELNEARGAICKLVSLAKQTGFYCPGLVEQVSLRYWVELINRHDVMDGLPEETSERDIAGMANVALLESNSMRDVIDFDDMVYLPLLRRVRMFQNDWVLVDECFLPDTPILTGENGEWMTIGEMVESQYTGPVLSWHPERGTVVSRVTGGKKVLRNKRLVQIRFLKKQEGLAESTRRMRFGTPIVVCTEDHKVWTPSGWKAAKELQPGETVRMETLQGRIPQYQTKHMISAEGKAALSSTLQGNTRGNGTGGTRENFNAVKGGNGRGLSRCEQLLRDKMHVVGIELEPHIIIPTKKPRGSGYPYHYKIDFAISGTNDLIEVDGNSHRHPLRHEQDQRKDALLSDMGYSVKRLTNRQVETLTPQELKYILVPGCLVDAEIVSVQDYETKEQYVYDIEVKDTHCYFAHGLLVHNCQDTNAVRRELAARMLKPGGRLVAVGDPHQAIYGFTGADNRSMEMIKERFNATTLKLSVSWRCPKVVVQTARQYVDHIRAADTAIEGQIRSCNYGTMLDTVAPGEAVLSRFNAPLVDLCFRLIREGKAAKIEGRAIGDGLVALVSKWKVKTITALESRLEKWYARECEKIESADKKDESKLDRLNDKYETVRVLLARAQEQGLTTLAELQAMIRDMFADVGASPALVVLSSVHRSKGLEWKTVYVLGRGVTLPSPRAAQEWQKEQEINLAYVAVTRAQETLIDVSLPYEGELARRDAQRAAEMLKAKKAAA